MKKLILLAAACGWWALLSPVQAQTNYIPIFDTALRGDWVPQT